MVSQKPDLDADRTMQLFIIVVICLAIFAVMAWFFMREKRVKQVQAPAPVAQQQAEAGCPLDSCDLTHMGRVVDVNGSLVSIQAELVNGEPLDVDEQEAQAFVLPESIGVKRYSESDKKYVTPKSIVKGDFVGVKIADDGMIQSATVFVK